MAEKPSNSGHYNDSEIKKRRIDILLKEIEMVGNNIKKFDEFSLIIKGWAITLWSALLFLFLERFEQLKNPEILLYVILTSTSFFWIFDALFKKWQRVAIAREKLISQFLNGRIKEIPLYDPMCARYRDKYNLKDAKFWRGLSVRINSTPYSALLITTLLLLAFTINHQNLNYNLPISSIPYIYIGISIGLLIYAILCFIACEMEKIYI